MRSMTKEQVKLLSVWKELDGLSYHPQMTRQYYGFADAQGNAVAIKSERGIILDSSEGLVLTNPDDAAKYMVGMISFAAVRKQKRFTFRDGNYEVSAWVEQDRFVAPCTCIPQLSSGGNCRPGGEDDCGVHGLAEDGK